MGIDARREIWQRVDAVPALTIVAGLFADLDLAAITDSRLAAERRFLAGQVGELENALLQQIGRGRAIFANVGLVQCIKEVVEFGREGG